VVTDPPTNFSITATCRLVDSRYSLSNIKQNLAGADGAGNVKMLTHFPLVDLVHSISFIAVYNAMRLVRQKLFTNKPDNYRRFVAVVCL